MRRVIMAVAVLGVALIVQLTAINGLRLPGGGVPDLVLAVVAALGLASGPAAGAVIGFAAGLALDLAPPGTGVLPARPCKHAAALQEAAKAGVEVLADELSLKERGIAAHRLAPGIKASPLDVVVDHLAEGRKTIWH